MVQDDDTEIDISEHIDDVEEPDETEGVEVAEISINSHLNIYLTDHQDQGHVGRREIRCSDRQWRDAQICRYGDGGAFEAENERNQRVWGADCRRVDVERIVGLSRVGAGVAKIEYQDKFLTLKIGKCRCNLGDSVPVNTREHEGQMETSVDEVQNRGDQVHAERRP